MDLLKNELTGNFEKFSSNWKKELDAVTKDLKDKNDMYFPSYVRVATMQAWRTLFLEHHVKSESLQFFLEAQNDAVTAHTLARMGAWRSSLKALRSCIENTYFCLYYMDHSVEQRLWSSGKHRRGFTELHKYFESHPDFLGQSSAITGLDIIKAEYATLSKAVHGSAEAFRMTAGAETTVIWTAEKESLSKWLSREKATLCALNQVLLVMFKSHLTGAALPGLRKSISMIFAPSKRKAIKAALSVHLPAH